MMKCFAGLNGVRVTRFRIFYLNVVIRNPLRIHRRHQRVLLCLKQNTTTSAVKLYSFSWADDNAFDTCQDLLVNALKMSLACVRYHLNAMKTGKIVTPTLHMFHQRIMGFIIICMEPRYDDEVTLTRVWKQLRRITL